jgi:hypothetical protein
MNPGFVLVRDVGPRPGRGLIIMVWFTAFAFRTLLSVLYLQIQA